MVVSMKSAAKAIAKVGTFTNLSDFERVGEQISQGIAGYRELMQTATIAAMVHLDKHGNYNVIKPLWNAATTFSAGEGRKWRDYLETYTHLEYNPKKLRGAALADAKFEDLWRKNKNKAMDIDGAKAAKGGWSGHVKARVASAAPVNLTKQVATYIKALNDLLQANRLIVPTADGKGIKRHATAADVRSELRSQLEEIVTKLRSVPGGKIGTRNPSTVESRSPETATPVRAARKAVTPAKRQARKAA